MNEKIIETNEDNDVIGDLRRSLNTEMPTRDQFHKWYNQLKNLPEFFEIAKQRTEQ